MTVTLNIWPAYHAVMTRSTAGVTQPLRSYDGARYRRMRDITFPMIRIYVGDDYESKDDETCAGEFYLDSLSVLPEFQRRGIASALIQEMFRQRDEAGIPLATIAVDPENDTAYRLYLRSGFRPEGHINVFGTNYDRLVCP